MQCLALCGVKHLVNLLLLNVLLKVVLPGCVNCIYSKEQELI